MLSFSIQDLIMWIAPIILGFGWAVRKHMTEDDRQHREILENVKSTNLALSELREDIYELERIRPKARKYDERRRNRR